jgi:amino acid adenylation domain-containing protein
MRVEDFLRASARSHGGKTALVSGERLLSYAELDDLSDRLASSLEAHGIRRGDRVLVFLENGWEAAVAIFAVLKAGAVFSPINPSTKADKLAFVMGNCRASAIVTQTKLAAVASAAMANVGSLHLAIVAGESHLIPGAVSFEDCLAVGPSAINHGGIDIDLAMLIYTSGSTGRPKGVMMTHRNADAASQSVMEHLGSAPDDIVLSVLPLAFNYGLYQLLMTMRIGGTLILEKSFAFPQSIFETMRRERVTGFPLVPTMAAMIVQIKSLQRGWLPDLRYITNTAAPLPEGHIAHLRDLLPDVRIHSMYGLTECKRCTGLPPEEIERRPGSVGIAIPNTEVFIVDEDGAPVEQGETGELVVRGPHVMQGYWEDEEATNAALRPGPNPWERVLYTGDLFYADAEGYLYFVGRKSDIIKSCGEKVAPKEVELVLQSLPGIVEALVVGVPDPLLGHAIKALVVVSDADIEARDIIRHCAKNLEDYMVPKLIEFRSELPKTDTGKVSRRLAQELMPERAGELARNTMETVR